MSDVSPPPNEAVGTPDAGGDESSPVAPVSEAPASQSPAPQATAPQAPAPQSPVQQAPVPQAPADEAPRTSSVQGAPVEGDSVQDHSVQGDSEPSTPVGSGAPAPATVPNPLPGRSELSDALAESQAVPADSGRDAGDQTAEIAGPTAAPVEEPSPVTPAVAPDDRDNDASEVASASGGDDAGDPALAAQPVETAPVETAPVETAPVEAEEPLDRPRGELPRIIAVANQKGGVGKTTSTINIGACLAELGFRTLIIDLDPQANATTGLGMDPRSIDKSLYDVVVRQAPLEDCIEPSAVKNLFVVPSSVQLAGAEIELVPMMSREHRLRSALEEVRDDFDYVLIDCPPSLGLLTVNALTAAREVLVPIQCEYYALEGLGQLLRNVELVKANLNPTLDVSTIVLVMYDARTKLAGQVVDEVRGHFGNRVCREVIPRTVRLSEAPSFGQPITVFDTASRGAEAYRAVTKEISGVTT